MKKIKLEKADAKLLGIDDSRPGRSERSPRKKRKSSVHTRKTKPVIHTVDSLNTSRVERGDYTLVVQTRPHGPPWRAWFDQVCDALVATANAATLMSEKHRIMGIDPWTAVEGLRDIYLAGHAPFVAVQRLINPQPTLPYELVETARALHMKRLAGAKMGPVDKTPDPPWRTSQPKPNLLFLLHVEFFEKLMALVDEYRGKLDP